MADPVATPIAVVQGATFTMQVTWTDASTDPATPISLDGYRALMQIRLRAGVTGTPLISLSSEGTSPALTLEPNQHTGVIKIRIGANNTRLLKKATYHYDLFVINKDDDTEAIRLVFGPVNVSKSVSVDAIA